MRRLNARDLVTLTALAVMVGAAIVEPEYRHASILFAGLGAAGFLAERRLGGGRDPDGSDTPSP